MAQAHGGAWRVNARIFALLLPAGAITIALMIVPLLGTLAASFTKLADDGFSSVFTLGNYLYLVGERGDLFRLLLTRSLLIASVVSIAVVALAYPIAYVLAFHIRSNKRLWLIVLTIPFWTSYLLRIFSWKVILGSSGIINSTLISLGILDAPADALLYSLNAVIIALVHAWLPFAILPIFVSLEKIDRSLLEAAADLGDSPVKRFLRVTLPLSMPGVLSAFVLVFAPTVGDYVTPALVGGPGTMLAGSLIVSYYMTMDNAPLGAASAILMLLVTSVLLIALALTARRWIMSPGRL